MLLQFKDRFPQLAPYWKKYEPFQKRIEVPARTIILEEGKPATHYIFIEKGCIRAALNHDGVDKTTQFFFENEGVASLESFLKGTPSLFSIESIEPSVLYLLSKKKVQEMVDELSHEPLFLKFIMSAMAERQLHYMHEFVSFIRDTPEQRYQQLLKGRPHIIRRVPQHYIASYLGISRVHLSRIKGALVKKAKKEKK